MGDEGEGRVIHMTLMKGKSNTQDNNSHIHAWFQCPLILSGVTIDPGIYISRGHYLLCQVYCLELSCLKAIINLRFWSFATI
jgi:hypothetical protein